jgi:hypothetical protein
MNKIKNYLIIIASHLLMIMIFYLSLCFQLGDVLLCDNESIEELKELVKSDTNKYIDLMAEHYELELEAEKLENIVLDKLMNGDGSELTEEEWDWLENTGNRESPWEIAYFSAQEKLNDARIVYDRIFLNEALIQESEPEYWCQVPKCHYFEESTLIEQNPPSS